MELEFSREIFGKKNTQISNFIKILPFGSVSFDVDRRTGMAKLVVAFGNFVNASEKESDLPRFIKFSDWKVRERERETERETERNEETDRHLG